MSITDLEFQIMNAFAGITLNAEDLKINSGHIDSHNTKPCKNEDGTYDVIFNMNFVSKELNYTFNNQLLVTKVDTDIQVELTGVTYNATGGWEWKKDETTGYTITAGDVVPNIALYKDDVIYGDFENDDFYGGIFTEEEDTILSRVLANNIIGWSDEKSIIEALSNMAKYIDHIPENN